VNRHICLFAVHISTIFFIVFFLSPLSLTPLSHPSEKTKPRSTSYLGSETPLISAVSSLCADAEVRPSLPKLWRRTRQSLTTQMLTPSTCPYPSASTYARPFSPPRRSSTCCWRSHHRSHRFWVLGVGGQGWFGWGWGRKRKRKKKKRIKK
jgi:hypothetical protein